MCPPKLYISRVKKDENIAENHDAKSPSDAHLSQKFACGAGLWWLRQAFACLAVVPIICQILARNASLKTEETALIRGTYPDTCVERVIYVSHPMYSPSLQMSPQDFAHTF